MSNNINIVKQFLNQVSKTLIKGDDHLEKELSYREAMRDEQGERAKVITTILKNYTTQQWERNDYKRKTKRVIFIFLMSIISLLTAAAISWITILFVLNDELNNQDLIGLVTTCISYLISVISLFLIIVKYVFPMDEEKNFNYLVTSIIQNDTERIKNDNEYLFRNRGKQKDPDADSSEKPDGED